MTTRRLRTGSLAKLIRVALADAETLDREKYRPTAAIWHAPEYAAQRHLPEPKRCRVCLAGAVIAGRLGGDIGREISPGNYTVETYDALYALDCARKGDWPEAYRRLMQQRRADAVPLWGEEISIPEATDFYGWAEFDKHLSSMARCADALERFEAAVPPSYGEARA